MRLHWLAIACTLVMINSFNVLCGQFIVTLDFSKDIKEQCLDQFKGHESMIEIESLTLSSDVFFQQDEIEYLLGFTSDTRITFEGFIIGFEYLKKKRAFERAQITFSPTDIGCNVQIFLYGQWTFKKVRFKGMLSGKDDYRHYYALVQGEPFEIKQHEYALQSINAAFKREGYCKAQVRDYLNYDAQTKSVSVYIYMDSGPRFVMKHIFIELEPTELLSDFESDQLTHKIYKKFVSRLQGYKYSENLINEETSYLKKYLEKKGFWDFSIALKEVYEEEAKSVSLKFIITLKDQRTFVFFGNHFFKTSQLRNELMSFGKSAGIVPSFFLSEELIDCYHKKGFWNATVNTHHQGASLYFVINEGLRAKIKEIEIRGAEKYTEAFLLSNFFTPCIRNRWYDYDLLAKQKQQLLDFYAQKGFVQTTIVDQKIESLIKNEHKIILTLDEGKQRILHKVSIDEYSDIELIWPFQIVEPIPFDSNLLDEQKYWLLNYFHKRGFSDVYVKPLIDELDDGVYVKWKVYGAQKTASFGKTVVMGNQKFPFKNIARELQYKHGQPWDRYNVEASMTKFRALDAFETVQMIPDSQDHEGAHAVLMKLVEDDPFEVRVRAGFIQVGKNLTFREGSSYKVGGSLLYKNPFNVGDHIFFNADFTLFFRNVSLLYYRPWIFNTPVHTVYKAYTNTYKQPVTIGSQHILYQAVQEGFLVGLTRAISMIDFGWNVGLEWMETKVVSDELARAINFQPLLVDKKIGYVFFEPSIMVDFLDDKLNPRQGSLTALSCKGMFPWQNIAVHFFKFYAEQSFFIPIKARATCGIRLRGGHIFNQKFENIMPPERFFLGGQNSLRSYQIDKAPPRGLYIDKHGKEQTLQQGGKSLLNLNAEFRFPLYGNLWMALFQDAGALFQSNEEIKEVINGGKILAASGFGFRYQTPIGPLRFDIGFKWKKQDPDESICAWFLTFGNAF